MIICCHFVTYNNFGPTDVFSEKVLGLSILRMGGKLGVVLFVMITGYFMLNKAFRWQRVIDLSKQTMYFSIIVVLLTYAFKERYQICSVLQESYSLLLWPIIGFRLILR
ncbi:hypothetical protein [Weissella cibaria]|uniref:hypothetical protein n=1 Tax=Weissella cibaria TaxID=137591 RepID=UPI0035CB6ED9